MKLALYCGSSSNRCTVATWNSWNSCHSSLVTWYATLITLHPQETEN